MTDKYNPKLRVKFLRTSTLNNTQVEPGNLIIDMDTEKMFMDILSSENDVKRIGITDFYTTEESDAKYVQEEHLQTLIDMLNEAASS